MKFIRFNLIVMVLLLIVSTSEAADDAFVGIVKHVEGSAVIQRKGKTLVAALGTLVLPTDTIRTEDQGTVGVVFSDDTRLSLGPRTEVLIEDYRFAPKESRFSFILRIVRGTVSFLSGQITKLAPESVELIVPDATIGVRGTHVLIKVD